MSPAWCVLRDAVVMDVPLNAQEPFSNRRKDGKRFQGCFDTCVSCQPVSRSRVVHGSEAGSSEASWTQGEVTSHPGHVHLHMVPFMPLYERHLTPPTSYSVWPRVCHTVGPPYIFME
jgi:hypothetical protein